MIKIFDNIIPTYLQDFIYDFITNENLDKNPPYPLFYMKNLTTKNIDVVKNYNLKLFLSFGLELIHYEEYLH